MSMLSVSFRLEKKEKLSKRTKKITNDLKSFASIQHKNLSSFLGATALQSTTVGIMFSMAPEYVTLYNYVNRNKGFL